jgi:hypothetical protein
MASSEECKVDRRCSGSDMPNGRKDEITDGENLDVHNIVSSGLHSKHSSGLTF